MSLPLVIPTEATEGSAVEGSLAYGSLTLASARDDMGEVAP